MCDGWTFFPSEPRHGEMEMGDTVVQKEGICNCDFLEVMFVGWETDLAGNVRVEVSAHLGCDKTATNRSHVVSPVVPGLGKFFLS